MEILEAVHELNDVHLRDKCERAITAVQRTIDLYGCVLPKESISEGFSSIRNFRSQIFKRLYMLQSLKLGFQLQRRQRLHRPFAHTTSSVC